MSGRTAGGLGQVVEAKLDENRVFKSSFGTGNQLGGGGPLDGDTQLSDPHAGQSHGRGGWSFDRVGGYGI